MRKDIEISVSCACCNDKMNKGEWMIESDCKGSNEWMCQMCYEKLRYMDEVICDA